MGDNDKSHVNEVNFRNFQKHYIDEMLREYGASETLVTGMLRMFECMDQDVTSDITLEDFIQILTDINEYRNKKQIDRLSKKEFS